MVVKENNVVKEEMVERRRRVKMGENAEKVEK